ncbi:MAG: Abi-alpha family protein [Haloechinothrix sp.]
MSKDLVPSGPRQNPAIAVAGGLFGRAGKLAGWAARTSYGIAKRIPGADVAERGLQQLERTALTELRKRIDEVTDPYMSALSRPPALRAASGQLSGSETATVDGKGELVVHPTRNGAVEPLRAVMADLLNRAVEYTGNEARESMYAVIIRQLTPDEARLMAALSDGSPSALIDIAERSGVNATGRILLRNISNIADKSGVVLRDQVPNYLTKLISLDLAEYDEEDPAMSTQYEILLTHQAVRRALDSTKRAKIIRRTIHISRFGDEFWKACTPTG